MSDETGNNTTGEETQPTKPKRKRATKQEMLERKRQELDRLKGNTQKLAREIDKLQKEVDENNRKKENNIKYVLAGYVEKRYKDEHDGQKMFDLSFYKDVKRIEEKAAAWFDELQQNENNVDEQTIREAKMYRVLCDLVGLNINKNTTIATLETRLRRLAPGTIQDNWNRQKKGK